MANITDEKALIGRIRKGSREAWNELVDGYGRLIYYSISRTLEMKGVRRSPEDIQDIFQSLFLHLAEDGGRRLLSYTGKHKCSLATWVRMITVNYTIDTIRRSAKYSFHVEYEDVSPEEFERSWFESQKQPVDEVAEKEENKKLLACLGELDKQERVLLEMYLSGMTPRQMARVCKISQSNVYSRYAAIKEKLKKSMESKG